MNIFRLLGELYETHKTPLVGKKIKIH